MQKKILRGLNVDEFRHPDEEENRRLAMNNPILGGALKSAANFCRIAIGPTTKGTFVQINEHCAPEIFKIIRNVCTILEVELNFNVYICHLMHNNIMPIGVDGQSYLVIPDYVLDTFDEEMLYYNFGNAITMIKADHVGLTTLAAYMPGGGLIEGPKMLFNAYLHSADITSDRGGLLASQNFAATARCQLFELGIPPKVSRTLFTTDKEAANFVADYLNAHFKVINSYSSLIMEAARKYQQLTYIEAPANAMLYELYEWYVAPFGYRKVLANHDGGYIEEVD